MEKEEVGDDDDDEEAPLRERDLNLELRVAQEERHCTIVASFSIRRGVCSSLSFAQSVSQCVAFSSGTMWVQKKTVRHSIVFLLEPIECFQDLLHPGTGFRFLRFVVNTPLLGLASSLARRKKAVEIHHGWYVPDTAAATTEGVAL